MNKECDVQITLEYLFDKNKVFNFNNPVKLSDFEEKDRELLVGYLKDCKGIKWKLEEITNDKVRIKTNYIASTHLKNYDNKNKKGDNK